MKKMTKRCLACVLAVLMVLCNVGIYFPEGAPTAEASGSSSTPTYMAKIVKTTNESIDRVGQTINVTAGKTYTISYKMYVVTKGNLQAFVNEDGYNGGACIVQGSDDVTGNVVNKTGTYTVPEGKTSIYLNFQCNNNGVFYLWDIKFTEQGSDVNLLTNADFTDGEGSWKGWKFSGWGGGSAQTVTDATKSDELESASGRKIILYNEQLFATDVENREELESLSELPSNKPAYMAKIVKTSNESIDRVGQTINVTAGKTYTISYKMYVVTKGNLQAFVNEDGYNGGACIVQGSDDVTGNVVNKTGTYTVPEGKTSIYLNFQCNNNGVFYLWDIKFTEEGSNENLLVNADFSVGEGSWTNWKFSGWGGGSAQTVTDATKSDELESASGRKIIAYNEQLFSTNVENREELEAGITKKYMAKIVKTSNESIDRVGQTIDVTAGKTYTISYKMYVVTKGNLQAFVNEDGYNGGACIVQGSDDVTGNVVNKTGTYTVPEGKTSIYLNFQCNNNGVFYLWDIKFTEQGSDVNLLTNADFTDGEGSWKGWRFSGWGGGSAQSVTDATKSDELESASGRKIIVYNEQLFSTDVENREELEAGNTQTPGGSGGTGGGNVPDDEELEGIPTGDPAYMAKIQVKSDANWQWVYQSITPEAGKTYRFTCNYYVKEGNGGNAVIWSKSSGDNGVSGKLQADTQGTIDVSLTAQEGDDSISARFECAPGTTVYVWNVCLREANGEYNLLTNGSFSKENGTWIGWKVVTNTTIKDKAASDAVVTTYGHEILPFNKDILPKPEVPEGIPTGDPAYMAKIQQKSDAKNWIWVYQGITPEAGKTYKFTCNYYVAEGESGKAVVWSSNNGENTDEKSATLKSETQGTVEIIYQLPDGDDRLNVRFETAPGTVCYVWNVCLSEEGGNVNLLKNGSLSKENGSWIGWQIGQSGVIKNKAASDAATEQYGPEIVAFNKDILPKPEVLEGIPTGDPKYMAKIQQKSDAKNWIWVYQGIQAEKGKTYKFTCNYYVAEGESGKAVVWSSNNGENTDDKSSTLKTETQGTVEIIYKLPDGDDRLNVRFETAPGTVCYVWNVCLSEVDGNVNLLKNGSFSKENGSWIGWQVKTNKVIKDKAGSDAATEAYGPEIVAFNKDILPKPEVLEGIPTGDPKYMAKIQQKSDAKNWIWVYQGIQTEQGKTYKFTCNYYVAEGESGKAVVWSSNNGKNTDEKSATLKTETQGTVEIIYKLPDGDDRLNVRFETAPGTVCYVWNVCLSEVDGNVNLLKNGSFSKGNGSWIGWQVKTNKVIKDKAGSDAATEAYGPEIVAFNKDILPKPEVLEGIPTGDPKYMAKIQQKADAKNWLWVYQGIQTEQGKTYKFTCNYYVAQGESGKAVVWSSNNGKTTGEKTGKLNTETQGTIEIIYQLPAGDDRLNVRFETAPGTVCYVWNVCLSEEGGSVNLLKNGSFSKENGSWIGWQVGQSGVIKNKTASDAATEKYGPEIVAFDSSIFPKPKGIPTGDPLYMAKLTGTHMDKDGKMNTYVNVRQSITPEPGKTYIFSCDYYDRASNAGASILLWSDTSKGSEGDAYGRFRARTQSGVEGKLELKYTATEGDTFIAVSMECDPDSECYMWNFCLREEGTDINLLKNSGFEAEDGTWISWAVGSMTVKTKADSDKLTELYGHKIMKFSRQLIESMKEEDAALKTYQDPNRAFSFDDVNKYKELDASALKLAVQKDTVDTDSDTDQQSVGTKGIWIATIAVATVGLGAVGIILFAKKKKVKKI